MITLLILLTFIAVPFTLYPALLWLRSRLAPPEVLFSAISPTVDLVICAHNEADIIEAKLHNALALDYPGHAITIWLASDGSTDATVSIARRFESDRLHVLELPRGGKAAVLNHAVSLGRGDVVAFSDANSMWRPDALAALVAPLAGESIGGVAGDQQYSQGSGQEAVASSGERGYWSFDRFLKSWQSRAGNVISATGAIYCVRRLLFEPAPADATDDFMVSTGVIAAGKRLVFAAGAVAVEPAAIASGLEFQRKVRVISRGLRSVWYRRALLNPRKMGLYAFELLVHKLWRRMVWVPLGLLILMSPYAIVEGGLAALVGATVLGSTLVASLALVSPTLRRYRVFSVAGFILMVNAACAVAGYNFVTGNRLSKWDLPRAPNSASCPETKP